MCVNLCRRFLEDLSYVSVCINVSKGLLSESLSHVDPCGKKKKKERRGLTLNCCPAAVNTQTIHKRPV